MNGLIGLLGTLAASNVRRTVARTRRNGILLAISGLLFLTTYLFGLIALALWLAVGRDPIFAALAIAVGTLVLGLIILVVMAIINKIEERRARERRLALESTIAASLSVIRSQPLLTAALAFGIVASNLIKPRNKN